MTTSCLVAHAPSHPGADLWTHRPCTVLWTTHRPRRPRRAPSAFAPHEVLLVVEVVSPGSVTLDRIAKPTLYAQAGIDHYWRVECDPGIVVHTHRLDRDAEAYAATGAHHTTLAVTEPWPVTVPVEALSPKRGAPPR